MGKIFFVGDSRVVGVGDPQGGWAGLISSRLINETLDGKLNVFPYNLGVRGNNISNVLTRAKAEIEARMNPDDPQEPIQIVISVGVNDTIYLNAEQKTLTSKADFHEFSDQLIKSALEITPNILVTGILPVDEKILDPIPWAPEASYKNRIIGEYEAFIEAVCQDNNVTFCPLFSQIINLENYQDLFLDGLHLTKSGNNLLNEIISDKLINEGFRRVFSS